MNQEEYDKKYQFNRRRGDSWAKKKVQNFGAVFTRNGFEKAVKRRVPLIAWLPRYKLGNLVSDFIAGVTVGIYNVPQAMSYSTLAGLPPVYGLYASFFPPILYAIFGTALHSNIGVFSITCLMINKCIEKMLHGEHADQSPALTNVNIITSLCLLTGIIQAFMAIIRCNKFMNFLSEPAISAITFSACFFGVVSQIPKFCGFSVPARNEPWFNLFYSIYDLLVHIPKSNPATVCVSVCALVFLIITDRVIVPILSTYFNVFKKVPFPKELITIIFATILSRVLNLEQNYGVKILKHVPTGFPSPDVPRTDIWPYILSDAFGIAVVAYPVTMAMGQIFARKHKYRLDSNQELLALGLVNIVSSFFPVFPTSCSLSRTLVNEKCGAKSQLSGFISALCILVVIMFLGPLLESLPSCVLAAIVLVVVEPLLRKVTELPALWRCSKPDFFIWILTAGFTLCSDIAQGVAAGIIFVIFNIAIQSQQTRVKILGKVSDNDFRPINYYAAAEETPFRIIQFVGGPVSENSQNFEYVVNDATNNITKKRSASTDSQETKDWTAIILDCQTWTRTDHMGMQSVKEVNEDMQRKHILLFFADLKSSIRYKFELAEILESQPTDEQKIAREEKRIVEEERRIQGEKKKIESVKLLIAQNKKKSAVEKMETGQGDEENAQFEMKLSYDEKQLVKAEKQLKKDKEELSIQKKKKLLEKENSQPASKSEKISRNQLYPSIQNAVTAAHVLVDMQDQFFDIKRRVSEM